MQSKFTQKNQSVDKVFQIIDSMAEIRMPLKLQEISKEVGFPASTTLRMLTSLVEIGYVYQDRETSKYSLTMKFCKIGDSVKSSFNITEIVRPYLIDISNKSGETAYFAIEQDMMLVYLDVVSGANMQNSNLRHIGRVAPLHSTGNGKLMLLNYDDTKLMKLAEEKGLSKLTNNTLTTIDELKREIEIIRKQGYAVDEQECEAGVRCVAMPIRDYTGRVIGGISVSGPTNRILPEKFENYLEMLEIACAEISSKSGY